MLIKSQTWFILKVWEVHIVMQRLMSWMLEGKGEKIPNLDSGTFPFRQYKGQKTGSAEEEWEEWWLFIGKENIYPSDKNPHLDLSPRINDRRWISFVPISPLSLCKDLEWLGALRRRSASSRDSTSVARWTRRSAASQIKSEIGSLASIRSRCWRIQRNGTSCGESAICRRMASKTSNGDERSIEFEVGDTWDSSLSRCSSKTSSWTRRSVESLFRNLNLGVNWEFLHFKFQNIFNQILTSSLPVSGEVWVLQILIELESSHANLV